MFLPTTKRYFHKIRFALDAHVASSIMVPSDPVFVFVVVVVVVVAAAALDKVHLPLFREETLRRNIFPNFNLNKRIPHIYIRVHYIGSLVDTIIEDPLSPGTLLKQFFPSKNRCGSNDPVDMTPVSFATHFEKKLRHICFGNSFEVDLFYHPSHFQVLDVLFLLNLSIRLEMQHYITHHSINNHPHNYMACLTHKSISLFICRTPSAFARTRTGLGRRRRSGSR